MAEVLATHDERDSNVIIDDISSRGEQQIISHRNYQKYILDYCEQLNSVAGVRDLSIHEKRPNISPLTIEVKMRDQTLKSEDIINLVKTYQLYIKENYITSSKDREKTCIVLKTEQPWEYEGTLFSRYMFLFPSCRVAVPMDIGDAETMTSEVVEGRFEIVRHRKFMPLYGSRIDKSSPALIFDNIFNPKGSIMNLANSFNPSEHSLFDADFEVTSELFEDKQEEAEYYLPIFLSSYYGKMETKSRKEEEDGSIGESSADSPEGLCNIFLPLLKQDRFAECYDDIGKAIFNSYGDTEIGFRVFMEWMERKTDLVGDVTKGEIRTRDDWELHFEEYENYPGITVKTLAWYASQDSPARYKEWHVRWYREAIDTSLIDQAGADFGEVFHRIMWLYYMYDSRYWYRFQFGKLVKLSGNIVIFKDITQNIIPAYREYRSNLEDQERRSRSNAERLEIADKIQNMPKAIKKLKDRKTKNDIYNLTGEWFYNEFCDVPLSQLMDADPVLLGCKGLIIELKRDKAITRAGKPEDYVTLSTKVRYRADYHSKHPDVLEYKKYMKMVYPVKEEREYAYIDMASQLLGGNEEKILRVLIGETNGSKTIFQKIGHTAFGDYAAVVPESFWGGASRGNGPSPEKAQLKHARTAYVFELPNNKSMDSADLKRTTGGDLTFARNCGEDGGAMEIITKFQISVNGFPDVKGLDYAGKSRLFMSPHRSSFFIKAKDEKKYEELQKMSFKEQLRLRQFPAESISKEKILKLANAFLWMAVQYYKVYKKQGLVPPASMKEFIEEYWREHDPLIIFMKEYIEPKDGGKIKKRALFKAYSRWFNECNFPYKQLSSEKFAEAIQSRDKLGKMEDGNLWKGWAIVEQEEESYY